MEAHEGTVPVDNKIKGIFMQILHVCLCRGILHCLAKLASAIVLCFEFISEIFQFPHFGNFRLSLSLKLSFVELLHEARGNLLLISVGRET